MSDVVCFTRTRWGDESARDHPLMSRFARRRRVFVIEAPARDAAADRAFVEEHRGPDGLVLCVPHLPSTIDAAQARAHLARLVGELRVRHGIEPEIVWAGPPAALELARLLGPTLVVWDCQSEPEGAAALERPTRVRAVRPDLVVTSPWDAHVRRRPHVRVMPPVLEVARPRQPRAGAPIDPVDLAPVPGPRIGLAAPLDPRLDVAMLARLAEELPELFVVALGAPRGIDARVLPCRPNVFWLGEKRAHERPHYLAGWDVAITPQLDGGALPDLALEALSMGIPVVATGLRELAHGIERPPLLRRADTGSVARAIEDALRAPRLQLAETADALRARFGWDAAFAQVEAWISAALETASRRRPGLALARSSA